VSLTPSSLLNYLDAPIVVGDPDGRTAYVNPAFEESFSVRSEEVTGNPLANLFEGGAREAVLRGVAEACERGENVRFRIRQGNGGFSAVASPIVAEDSQVGVVILMVETAAYDERFQSLYREVVQPLDALVEALGDVLVQIRGQRAEYYRSVIEDGIHALGRIRDWSDEKFNLLSGAPRPSPEAGASFDVAPVVRAAGEQMGNEFTERGVKLEVRPAYGLPPVAGESVCLEQALVHLLRKRLEIAPESASVTLSTRRLDADGVLISIVDAAPSGESGADVDVEPELVLELVRDLGGTIRTSIDPIAGRTTAIQLDPA
jgi:PAS domain S-box-containing protein